MAIPEIGLSLTVLSAARIRKESKACVITVGLPPGPVSMIARCTTNRRGEPPIASEADGDAADGGATTGALERKAISVPSKTIANMTTALAVAA
jgi:hypothetical protein